MADAPHFAKLVPGFDFLQSLAKNAGASMPAVGQWVAPTLNPEELEKRISELRTVQFWLEQNARLLETTIQALEVQRMTLATLKTMNVQMDHLRDSLKIQPTTPTASTHTGSSQAASAESLRGTPDQSATRGARGGGNDGERAREVEREDSGTAADSSAAPARVDPMKWWGALTQQFSELAATAMRDTAAQAAAKSADGTSGGKASTAGKRTAKSTRSTAAKRRESTAAKNSTSAASPRRSSRAKPPSGPRGSA